MSKRFSAAQAGAALLLAIVCLWVGTQWWAAMLGYQAALGAAWIELAGLNVYAPWKLFSWWLAFDRQAREVFACAGALAAVGGLLSGALALGGAARRASHRSSAITYVSARWAGSSDVRKADLLGDRGVILGRYGNRYLRHDGREHVLAVPPTRSGKGVGPVLPTLLSWTGSAVAHGIKGENWTLTAGWRAQFSHCLRFDPNDPLSARFNPLLEVRKGAHEVRDAQNIAGILVDPVVTRAARPPGEDLARHPAPAPCGAGQDAGAGGDVSRRSVTLDPAHAQDHADDQPPWQRGRADGAPGRCLHRPRAAEQVRQRPLGCGVDRHGHDDASIDASTARDRGGAALDSAAQIRLGACSAVSIIYVDDVGAIRAEIRNPHQHDCILFQLRIRQGSERHGRSSDERSAISTERR